MTGFVDAVGHDFQVPLAFIDLLGSIPAPGFLRQGEAGETGAAKKCRANGL
jgi:hypothetical protein